MKTRVAVLISGSGSNLQALIDAASHACFPARIEVVISNKDDAYGLERARKAGIRTEVLRHNAYATREEYDAALHVLLDQYGIELVCLAGFMRILSARFVGKWHGRMLNIHPSLLPAYRGLHTHASAIADGVKISGCTVHYVVPELDAGPIIIQAAVSVLPDDTDATLAARVLAQEHIIYPKALGWVAEGNVQLNSAGRVEFSHCHNPTTILINPE